MYMKRSEMFDNFVDLLYDSVEKIISTVNPETKHLGEVLLFETYFRAAIYIEKNVSMETAEI